MPERLRESGGGGDKWASNLALDETAHRLQALLPRVRGPDLPSLGGVILDGIYGSEYEQFRSSSGRDGVCRELAVRLGGAQAGVSGPLLRHAVLACCLARWHADVRGLTRTHLKVLAGLPAEDLVALVARRATPTVIELRRAAAPARARIAKGTGRKRVPEALKAARAVERLLARLRGSMVGLAGLDAQGTQELALVATHLVDTAEKIRAGLRAPSAQRGGR